MKQSRSIKKHKVEIHKIEDCFSEFALPCYFPPLVIRLDDLTDTKQCSSTNENSINPQIDL